METQHCAFPRVNASPCQGASGKATAHSRPVVSQGHYRTVWCPDTRWEPLCRHTPDSWPEATLSRTTCRQELWRPQAAPSRPSGASASLALSPAVDEAKAGRPGLRLNLSRAPGPHPPFFSCWGGGVELFGGLHILAAGSCLGIMTEMPHPDSFVQRDWLSPGCKGPS